MATSTRRKSSVGGKDISQQKTLSSSKTNATTGKGRSQVYNIERIKELENQVLELKKRLDDLRKAKSQTILKKDKEYVSLDNPKLGQRLQSSEQSPGIKKAQELEQAKRSADKEISELRDEIEKLKIDHAKELEISKTQSKEAVPDSEELLELRKKCKALQEKNDSLEALNTEQNVRINELCEQLSRKEAEWCTKEEKLKVELKFSFGEKYQQWMAQTEQKIEELQAANNFLKMVIQRDRDRSNTSQSEGS
ncbi:protein Spindly-like [Actinia tenebrosa]|uniref:Protein Spindly-like n=1 Tax=Actinia tenebrosa TaxID=6105 RepID=A0A6P8HCK1_ACTTE|nr:protein Spindly-like [Actinia tenebrosa]